MASSILAKMAVIIDGQTAGFNKAMAQSQGQLKSFQTGIATVAGSLGIAFGAATVFAGLKAGIDIMADFERTMSEVKAITGATGKEFEALEKDALKLGAATKFSATEVGQLQVAYGRLGFNTQEILDATKATLDLAAATGEDLAKSADVAGSTVRGFGLDAKETQRVVDVMAASFNQTALGLDNFTESMKYVAPIAQAANVTVEETTALLGVLADAGIRGSSAGTALRKIFGDLSKDGRPVLERLDELGKKGITLSDSFDEVGRTAQTALLVLAKNREKADGLTTSFQHVEGEAAKMAKTMSDNLTGDLDQLSGAFEGLILSGNGVLTPLREVVQAVTDVLNAFTKLASGSGEIGKFFKFLSDQAILPIKLLGLLAKAAGDTSQPLEDNAEKLRAIASTVDAAFNSGNIEAYIKALDQNIYREEIIAEIRKRQTAELAKQVTELKPQSGLIQAIEEKIKSFEERKKSAFTVGEIAIFNDKIASLRTQLELLNEATNKPAQNIEAFRKALSGLGEAYDQTNTSDTSRLRILASEIDHYENLIQQVERVKASFKDFDFIVKPPDVTPLVNGLKTIQETAGSLTFETTISSLDQVTERFESGLAKMAVSAKTHTDTIKGTFIDMGPLISNALTGVADALGQAIGGVGNFGDNIIKVVASFARQFGEILIATGTAMLAAKLLIKNPYTAIIAGAALVALSSAAGAAISKSHSASFGGTGAGGGKQVTNVSQISTADASSIVKFDAQFTLRGQDLVASVNSTNNRNNRLGG